MSRLKLSEIVLLVVSIFLFLMAFISEWYFHIYWGFMPDNPDIPTDIFWMAEYSEVFNSMTFLISGIILFIVDLLLIRKRKKCQINPTDFCRTYF